jgi:hypothetical protein
MKLFPAEVTEFPSKYWETTEGKEGTCEELVKKKTWKAWQQNTGTQPQNVIHAINFHANNMYK